MNLLTFLHTWISNLDKSWKNGIFWHDLGMNKREKNAKVYEQELGEEDGYKGEPLVPVRDTNRD